MEFFFGSLPKVASRKSTRAWGSPGLLIVSWQYPLSLGLGFGSQDLGYGSCGSRVLRDESLQSVETIERVFTV